MTPDHLATQLRARLGMLTASMPELMAYTLAQELERDIRGDFEPGTEPGMIEWLTNDYGPALTIGEIAAFREGWRAGARAAASQFGYVTTTQGRR